MYDLERVASVVTSLPMEFQHSKNIWKQVTRKFGLNELNGKRLLGWEIEDQQKKGLAPPIQHCIFLWKYYTL
jgi:hypothetical protein